MNIGLDIGGNNIKGVLAAIGADIVSKTSIPTEANQGTDHVIEQIQLCIKKLSSKKPKRESITGVGIGVPGTVDRKKGIVINCPNLTALNGVHLEELVSDRWGVPVSLENDANCAALGEAKFGAGKGFPNFMGITLGTGVGSGIILNGELYVGPKGFGGEFGHMSIDYHGPMCACGRNGCIEAYTGIIYLVTNALQHISQHPESSLYSFANTGKSIITPKQISEAAEKGDKTAQEVFMHVGEKLGIAISNVVNLLDMTTFVIGGGISSAGKPLFRSILTASKRHVLKVHRSSLRILSASLGNDAGMLGAASLR